MCLIVTLAAFSSKHNVGPNGLCPSVCHVFFLTLVERATHIQRDSLYALYALSLLSITIQYFSQIPRMLLSILKQRL